MLAPASRPAAGQPSARFAIVYASACFPSAASASAHAP
jgi:hypothetical protein